VQPRWIIGRGSRLALLALMTQNCSSTLLELGPAIIGGLTKALGSPNRAVRAVSAQVLGVLGQRGKHIEVAVPALEAASRDRCPQVAARAKWALSGLQQSYHD
jgi:HEAT repeat protein